MKSLTRSNVATIPVPTPFPVGPVNVHLIRRDPVTLVDTGPATGRAWRALVDGLSREGLAPRDVKRVLVTHGHQDHFGLAARLADAGAELHAGRLDGRLLRKERGSPALLDDMARSGFGLRQRFRVLVSGILIDGTAEAVAGFRPLDGGESLDGDGYRVDVLATPGHTPGSLAFHLPQARVLFTGDTVLEGITPNAVVTEDPERRGRLFVGLGRYLETLEKLRPLARRSLLLTGHGASVTRFEPLLSEVKRRYLSREGKIERLLAERPRTVRELARELFPRLDAINLFLAYSEVRGFLGLMAEQGRARREEGPLLDRWAPAA